MTSTIFAPLLLAFFGGVLIHLAMCLLRLENADGLPGGAMGFGIIQGLNYSVLREDGFTWLLIPCCFVCATAGHFASVWLVQRLQRKPVDTNSRNG